MAHHNKTIDTENLAWDYPSVASEWDYTKNDGRPEDYNANSGQSVYWLCPNGHSYRNVIHRRTHRGYNCPICSGKLVVAGINDLETVRTDLMDEWDFNKNLSVFPTEVSIRSNKKVWWKCQRCGHNWEACISNRTRGSGCPNCRHNRSANTRQAHRVLAQGSFASLHPDLLLEWDYKKNDSLSPEQIVSGSQQRVWWKCPRCGKEWQAAINYRAKGWSRCPTCHPTRPKRSLPPISK